MKRFWTQAAADGAGGVSLDGRPVRTPGRAPLLLPTRALAEAIAGEWNAVGDAIDPRAMPLTGLANAAIDRIAPDPAGFARGVAAYGESDLLCYRADGPAPLVERQAAAWDPPLKWAQARFDVHFETATGIVHRAQPPATLQRLAAATAALGPFPLAAASVLTTLTGSLVLALALTEAAIAPAAAWEAATVDEEWQAERWGRDPLAEQAMAMRRAEFDAATAFLAALQG